MNIQNEILKIKENFKNASEEFLKIQDCEKLKIYCKKGKSKNFTANINKKLLLSIFKNEELKNELSLNYYKFGNFILFTRGDLKK